MKKIMMTFLLLSSSSFATVNLQTGAWHWNSQVQGLNLTYNSRTLHQGWWGQGWCSDLDARIIQSEKDNSVKLLLCGNEVNEIDVSKIPLGHVIKHKAKSFMFNNSNQLVEVISPEMRIKIEWQGVNPGLLQLNNQPPYLVKVNQLRRTIESLVSKEKSVNFVYERNLLIQTPNESYSYDRFDNLISIQSLSENSIMDRVRINYTADDRVEKVGTSQGCISEYSFNERIENSQLILDSRISRKCSGKENEIKSRIVSSKFEINEGFLLTLTQTKENTL
jgi:hypothetical protein